MRKRNCVQIEKLGNSSDWMSDDRSELSFDGTMGRGRPTTRVSGRVITRVIARAVAATITDIASLTIIFVIIRLVSISLLASAMVFQSASNELRRRETEACNRIDNKCGSCNLSRGVRNYHSCNKLHHLGKWLRSYFEESIYGQTWR